MLFAANGSKVQLPNWGPRSLLRCLHRKSTPYAAYSLNSPDEEAKILWRVRLRSYEL